MESWSFYVVNDFKGKKQREELCQKIKKIVADKGLSAALPMVKYETGQKREYYLGIAINEYSHFNSKDLIQKVRSILESVGITRGPIGVELIPIEEIQELLKGTPGYESFTTHIKYESSCEVEILTCEEVLSLSEIDLLEVNKQNDKKLSEWENLLYWCSTQGSGDLGRLRQACQLLGISTEYGGAWSVLRNMTLLGNLEFHMNHNSLRWEVVEPVVVQTAIDNSSYFIAGQRSPALIESLNKNFQIRKESPATGPSAIYIEQVDNPNTIESVDNFTLKNVNCASVELLHLLPDIETWKNMLPIWNEKDFGRYKTKKYISASNTFENCILSTPSQGLYQFSIDGRRDIMAYYCEVLKQWISGDFYGLRFLARISSAAINAWYNENDNSFVISSFDRVPMPYERALVLASGKLPEKRKDQKGQDFLKYSDISDYLAEFISELLKINLWRS